MSSRTLLIHIGNHKTGTTSIQRALYLNRAELEQQGFALFHRDLDGSARSNGNALPWVKFRLSARHRIEGRIRKGFADQLAALPGNVIVSAETLSWVFSESNIRVFQRSLARHFDNIRIVAYLRRQDRQALSQYQQASRPDAFVAAYFYHGSNRALPPFRDNQRSYLDYAERLGRWSDAFGHAALSIRCFEKARLHGGDAVDDFATISGLQLPHRPERLNESLGYERTKVGHLYNAQQLSPEVWQKLAPYLDNSGRLLPARAEAETFYSHFEDSNRRLAERFSGDIEGTFFDESFTDYPVEPQDAWTEETANRALGNLLQAAQDLSSLPPEDQALIGECAGKLEAIDPDASEQLRALLERHGDMRASTQPLVERLKRNLKALLRARAQ